MVSLAVGQGEDSGSEAVGAWGEAGKMGNVWYPWLQLEEGGPNSMGVTGEGRAV